MKMLHLSIICGAGIVGAIALIFSFANMYPLVDTPNHNFRPWIEIDTPGLQKTYHVGQKVNFTISIKGLGVYPCTFPGVKIYLADKFNSSIFESNETPMSCPVHNDPEFYEFYFPNKNSSFIVLPNQTGKYTLSISYGTNSLEKYFFVNSTIVALINNDILTPMSTPVTNTNFTVNYDIEGAKVFEIKQDIQSKSLIVSIKTTSDGQLIINLPRELIDAKIRQNMDDAFIVLGDRQEIKYKEIHKTMADRTLLIPFLQGTNEIEIIGVSPI